MSSAKVSSKISSPIVIKVGSQKSYTRWKFCVFRPLTYPTAERKKARELNVPSELFSCLRGRRAGRSGVDGLRAIIWLLGGVRGGSACCHVEEGPGMAAASCGGPYKRVNSVLLAVNILRLRRSARAVCSCSRRSPRLCLSATFSRFPFPSRRLCLHD